MDEQSPQVVSPQALLRMLELRRPTIRTLKVRMNDRELPVTDVWLDPVTGEMVLIAGTTV